MPYQRSWKLATVVDDGPNGGPEFTWQEIETWIFHSYIRNNCPCPWKQLISFTVFVVIHFQCTANSKRKPIMFTV